MHHLGLRNAVWVLVTAAAFAVAHAGLTQSAESGGRQEFNAPFDVVEASIADIHAAMRDGRVTSRQLVQSYIERIEAYDKQGPAVNAIITVNPGALRRAQELDDLYSESGMVGPLHGIPVIVKDNYDTADMPTTAGSLSLRGSTPTDDAFQVRRLREAGAIVLAKSNMAEFAFTPYETVGSALPGHTRNPYALNRVNTAHDVFGAVCEAHAKAVDVHVLLGQLLGEYGEHEEVDVLERRVLAHRIEELLPAES